MISGTLALQSSAYMLEGPHVLDLMVAKMAGTKTLRVFQKVEIEDPVVVQQTVQLNETLSYIFPERFRSDAWFEGTNRIFVTSFGRTLTVIDGKVSDFEEGRFDRYKDPLLYQTRYAMLKALLKSGVDVGVTTLGQADKNPAFVIGAQYPDISVSQLWIDKERFLPIRFIIIDKDASSSAQRLEFVYLNWQSFEKCWYPMLIETYHNKELIRRVQARNVMLNLDFSHQLFDIAYLMGVYGSADKKGEQTSSMEQDEVKQTIDDFKKKFDP
jgi:hypothetical protein